MLRKTQLESHMPTENFIDPMCEEYAKEEHIIDIQPPPIEMCKKRIKLKGPFSSLSVEPHGLTESTRNSKIYIDKHSVNSVMLENDPQVSY